MLEFIFTFEIELGALAADLFKLCFFSLPDCPTFFFSAFVGFLHQLLRLASLSLSPLMKGLGGPGIVPQFFLITSKQRTH